MIAHAPEIEQRGGYGEDDRSEDDAGDSKESNAAKDGDENDGGVAAQAGANQNGIEEVVDGADDDASPDCEQQSFSPMAGDAEIDGDGAPDQESAEGRNHGHDSGAE